MLDFPGGLFPPQEFNDEKLKVMKALNNISQHRRSPKEVVGKSGIFYKKYLPDYS